MHAPHQERGIVLHDQCEQCVRMARDLWMIDTPGLTQLADVAAALQSGGLKHADISHVDYQASEQLRLWARIVFSSGITEEVAR